MVVAVGTRLVVGLMILVDLPQTQEAVADLMTTLVVMVGEEGVLEVGASLWERVVEMTDGGLSSEVEVMTVGVPAPLPIRTGMGHRIQETVVGQEDRMGMIKVTAGGPVDRIGFQGIMIAVEIWTEVVIGTEGATEIARGTGIEAVTETEIGTETGQDGTEIGIRTGIATGTATGIGNETGAVVTGIMIAVSPASAEENPSGTTQTMMQATNQGVTPTFNSPPLKMSLSCQVMGTMLLLPVSSLVSSRISRSSIVQASSSLNRVKAMMAPAVSPPEV